MFDILDLRSNENSTQEQDSLVSEELNYATIYFGYYPYLAG